MFTVRSFRILTYIWKFEKSILSKHFVFGSQRFSRPLKIMTYVCQFHNNVLAAAGAKQSFIGTPYCCESFCFQLFHRYFVKVQTQAPLYFIVSYKQPHHSQDLAPKLPSFAYTFASLFTYHFTHIHKLKDPRQCFCSLIIK